MPPREEIRKPPFSFRSGFLQGAAVADFNGDTFDPPRYNAGAGGRDAFRVVAFDIAVAARQLRKAARALEVVLQELKTKEDEPSRETSRSA